MASPLHTPLALVAALTLAAPVCALDSDSDSALDTIVVTARKREENVQRVPVAISVLDTDYLQLLTPQSGNSGLISGQTGDPRSVQLTARYHLGN